MKNKFNYEAFVEQVSLESGFDVNTSENYTQELFTLFKEQLLDHKEVHVRNFGTFKSVWHAVRNGFNPQLKSPMRISAHNALKFHASKNLLDTVNKAQGYQTGDDVVYDHHLGLKHYTSIVAASIVAVFILFFLPEKPNHHEPIPKDHYVTIPHGVHHWDETVVKTKVQAVKQDKATFIEKVVIEERGTSENVLDIKTIKFVDAKTSVTHDESYTIRKNDTLSTIAKRHYGHAEYWPLIYEQNSQDIGDPDKIFVGMSIKVPELNSTMVQRHKPQVAQAYVSVYKHYQRLGKIKSAQWVLWMGVNKVDDCLLADYVDEIAHSDVTAVKAYLACNVEN